jgi:hypothetical protein
MLPKCVLATLPRAGKKYRNTVDNYTRSRLHRWLDRERD